jgi:hypothetical protein
MKIKNYLKSGILILTTLFLISCGSDDDSNNPDASADLIIGKWIYQAQSENGVTIPHNDCEPSTTEFSANGDVFSLYYGTNNNGDCVVVDTVNGDWEKLPSGQYQFNFDGDNFNYMDTVIFENNNNRLILEDTDTDGNGNVIVYRFEYNRE